MCVALLLPCSCSALALPLTFPPSVAPRSAVRHRGKANCLRPGMAELFAGRWLASTAGYRADAVRPARLPGCPFLCLLSFGQAKESRALAAEASGTKVQHTQERAKNQSQERDACPNRNDDARTPPRRAETVVHHTQERAKNQSQEQDACPNRNDDARTPPRRAEPVVQHTQERAKNQSQEQDACFRRSAAVRFNCASRPRA